MLAQNLLLTTNRRGASSKQAAAVVVNNADCSPIVNVTEDAAWGEPKSRAIVHVTKPRRVVLSFALRKLLSDFSTSISRVIPTYFQQPNHVIYW